MYHFAAVQQTSKAKSATLFQKFLKIVRILRVNKTKVTWRNTFAENRFELESEKESKNDERNLF